MAGEIESSRTGTWENQAISRLNPGRGVNLVISGPVSSSLVEGGESSVNLAESGELHIVGLGLRKDSGYLETMMTCREIWIPFKDTAGDPQRVVLKVDHRTSYPNWIYVWAASSSEENRLDNTWLPSSFSGEDIYNTYENFPSDLDYEIGIQGPGNILFIPYIHPNYLTTDDYNGILGNVMATEESEHLYTVLQGDLKEGDRGRNKLSPNLRYKNYLEDYHKYNAIGGSHVGELNVPGDNISRCEEEGEYFRSFRERARELHPGSELDLQTLDFPYMSYRAISASIYVDQYVDNYSESGRPIAVDLRKVWEDLQKGNTDDAETIYFIGTASIVSRTASISEEGNFGRMYDVIEMGSKSTVPVQDSILFRMDGHLAVRITKATVYAPFLNTVYRTGEYGEITELFTSSSEE